MGVQQLDLKLQRGTYGLKSVFSFTLTDVNGALVNPKDPSVKDVQLIGGTVVQRLLSDGGLTVDSNNNVLWIPTSAEIEALPQGRMQQYYIEVTNTDGISGTRYLEGFFIVNGIAVVPVSVSDTAQPMSTGNNAAAAASTP